ncbi:MAG: hypothetical protein ACLRMZ_00445 [Blautia marasmi]
MENTQKLGEEIAEAEVEKQENESDSTAWYEKQDGKAETELAAMQKSTTL